jgi:hypothetical protein
MVERVECKMESGGVRKLLEKCQTEEWRMD